jgi:hypothetical protein
MRRPPTLLPVVGLLLLSATGARAQSVQNVVLRNSFNPLGAGARGLGMGGAFIGVADDGTAASFNPAGLAQLRRSELALVGFTDEVRATRTDLFTDRTLTERTRHSKPDFGGLAVPFEVAGRNLTVQLSYQRAVDLFGKGAATTRDSVSFRDLRINLPGSAELRGDIAPEQSGAFHTVSAAAAYQATSRLSLGLAVNYWFADWTATGRASFRIFTAPPARPTELRADVRDFSQKQNMNALSLNAGWLVKHSWFSLGGVLRLPFTGDYELEETGRFVSTEAGRAPISTPVSVSMGNRLHWPRSTGIGVALRPFRRMTLAADFSKSYWSLATLDDVVDGALLTPTEPAAAGGEPEVRFTNRNFFDLAPAAQTLTEDTSQLRAGAEYLIPIPKVVVPLRGGLFRDESPVRDLGKNKARRIQGWTAGTGLNFSRLVLDVAFERRTSEGVVGIQVRRGQGASTAQTEKVREDRIVASLIFRFGADDPVKKFLRALFVGAEEKGEN